MTWLAICCSCSNSSIAHAGDLYSRFFELGKGLGCPLLREWIDQSIVASAAIFSFSWTSLRKASHAALLIMTPNTEDDWCQPGVAQYFVTWWKPPE